MPRSLFDVYGRVAQPSGLNWWVPDPSRVFEASESLGFSRPLDFPIGRRNIGARNLGNGLGTAIAHHQFQFALHNFDHAIDAGLAERSQSPQEGTPDPYGFGAQRESLEYIRAAAKAAVDEDRHAAADFGHHFRQRLDGRTKCFCVTSTLVRYHKSI